MLLRLSFVALLAMVLLMTACSGTVSLSGAGGNGVVPRWPTATPLTGEVPVGRWACVFDADLEGMKSSNSSSSPQACFVLDGGAISFHPDSSGYDLKQYKRES